MSIKLLNFGWDLAQHSDTVALGLASSMAGFTTGEKKVGWVALLFMLGCAAIAGGTLVYWALGMFAFPGRLKVLEDTMVYISQDLCVIRAATEGLDAVECLRRIR
jgi:hypothetical protein